jgi:TraX protein
LSVSMGVIAKRLHRYGRQVNQHDVIKVIATALMVTDHLGLYAFDKITLLRIIGRGAAPLFFFLVGYAPHHRFDWRLVVYGSILTATNLLFHDGVYINILINFVIIKFMLTQLDRYTLSQPLLALLIVLLIAIHPLLSPYFEYGSSGALIALAARVMATDKRQGAVLVGIALAYHFAYQALAFHLVSAQLIVLLGVSLFTYVLLYTHRQRLYKLWPQLLWLLVSRYSLAIYFWHLLLLKVWFVYQLTEA